MAGFEINTFQLGLALQHTLLLSVRTDKKFAHQLITLRCLVLH